MTLPCAATPRNRTTTFARCRSGLWAIVLAVTFVNGSRDSHAQSAANPFEHSTAVSQLTPSSRGIPVKTPIDRGAANTPLRPSGNSRASSPLWTFATLSALLAGIWMARTYTQRRRTLPGRHSRTAIVNVVESTPVDGQLTVHVLRVGTRALIVGASTCGLTTLAEITDPAEVADLLGTTCTAFRSTADSLFQDAQPIRQTIERRVDPATEQLSRRMPAPLPEAREPCHV